jgi:hypothetical protein
MAIKRTIVTGLAAASVVLASGLAFAAGQYGPGVSDTRRSSLRSARVRRSNAAVAEERA